MTETAPAGGPPPGGTVTRAYDDAGVLPAGLTRPVSSTTLRPVDAETCAEEAAATLRHAERIGEVNPDGAAALAMVAGEWNKLAVSMRQHGLARTPDDE